MDQTLRLRLVVSPVPVDPSAEYTAATFPSRLGKNMASYAVCLSSIFSSCTATSEYVIALAHKLNVPWVTARGVIAYNVIKDGTPIIGWKVAYEFLIHQAVYFIGLAPIVKSPITSVSSSMPYPTVGVFGNCYLTKESSEFAFCKHTNIIHKEGL